MTKAYIWLGLLVGSSLGGWIPSLFGADLFSAWGIIGSTIGGLLGIYLGYKLSEDWL